MNPTYVLLGLLLKGEQHGYELKRTIDQECAPFWKLDWGQLYRSLAKMKRQRWIKLQTKPRARSKKRKVYAITAAGRHVCKDWLNEPASDYGEFLIKLYVAESVRFPTVQLMQAQQQVLDDERAARQNKLHDAQLQGNTGRIMLAQAALREIENRLTIIKAWSGSTPSQNIEPGLAQTDNWVGKNMEGQHAVDHFA